MIDADRRRTAEDGTDHRALTDRGAIARLTATYRAGEADPVAVCVAALDAAGSSVADGSFLRVTRERALREATASAERYSRGRPRGVMDGVPVVVKDSFDVAGTRTTVGSATRRQAPVSDRDAVVVSNLARAGAVCLGKTALSEFAFSGLGLNPHFGNVRNPRHAQVDRIPGGSSSGSAVAVAAGIAPVGLGTDTSGSVRVPAAFCEIAGFKASDHRYDKSGVWPLSVSLDSLGILAHEVADIVALDAAMRRTGTASADPAAPRRIRVVVPTGELVDDTCDDVAQAFAESMGRLADRDVTVTRARIPALDEAQRLMTRHGTIVLAEAHQRYGHLLARRDVDLDPLVLRRLSSYAGIKDRVHAVFGRCDQLRQQVAAELGDAVLVCPTVRDPAPPMAPLLADLDLAEATNARVLRSTMVMSYLGMPGVALPIKGSDGTSTASLLLSLPRGQDDRLLATALTVEDAVAGAGPAE